jgi:topoisomerase IA-like protein
MACKPGTKRLVKADKKPTAKKPTAKKPTAKKSAKKAPKMPKGSPVGNLMM